MAGHPKHIIFLTADAFGVLPPVSRLTPEQASYHFISGYTAKVAGTEMGVVDPVATFSACFGAAFMMWHPNKYASLLSEKMREHGAQAWLVNTGWTGGPYGTGSRIKLPYTRAIIDAIHNGAFDGVPTVPEDRFGVQVPQSCPGVPSEVLDPRSTWADKEAYDRTREKLVQLFRKNFERFKSQVDMAITAAGPN